MEGGRGGRANWSLVSSSQRGVGVGENTLTVRFLTHSELIPRARKIEFESCKKMKKKKKRPDSELSKKNGGINRPTGIFSKHFRLIQLAGLRVLKHFFEKNFTSISLHFVFHFPFHFPFSFLFHLFSSFSSCLTSLLSCLSSFSSCLIFSLLLSCFFSLLVLSLLSSFIFTCLFSPLSSSLVFSRLSSFIFLFLLFSCLHLCFLVLSCLVLSLFLCLSLCFCLSLSQCLSVSVSVWCCVLWCCVVCVVQMINDTASLSWHVRAMHLIGWQNTWEQAPGVPATPSPP